MNPLHATAVIVVSGVVFTTTYFLLPLLQSLLLPEAPADGWLVRPPRATRFGATIVISCFMIPFLMRWLWRRAGQLPLVAREAEKLKGLPVFKCVSILGFIVLILYGFGGVLYFSAYTSITDQEIAVHNIVNPRRYEMDDIASLVEIPEGFHVKTDYGPMLFLHFQDGSFKSLSLDCEGLTPQDLLGMRRMLSERSGKPWQRDPRAVLR